MNRAGQLVFAWTMLVIVAIVVFFSGCGPACRVIDVAHEACVIIPLIGADGGVTEVKVSGKVAMEYINSGRIGAERCPR